jgi:2-polyprenyl-3-methyl-5-hydroxy-6-metoxy-1,4-benzoquinol methylase
VNHYLPCDLCGSKDSRFLLDSPRLDGPLVECRGCGLRYVGRRNAQLAFGREGSHETADRVRQANLSFRHLRLEEEHRLALLNARWRLELIRKLRPSGSLLEIGCARGEFLQTAKEHFDARGVEPNPDLADFAGKVAPVCRETIERTPWSGFDVIASFHVIEHVDSPNQFVRAAAERLKPGGLIVIETPDIESMAFRIFRSRWRQFIPEHYFFFTPRTMRRLLTQNGLSADRIMKVGKYASVELICNRLSRYSPWIRSAGPFSRLTFRINPMDIMLAVGTRQGP